MSDKEETIKIFVNEMINKNHIHYNFCIKMHPWIKDYSNRKLVESSPKALAHCINKMLYEYSLRVWIEIDEIKFKKMISEVERKIFQLENEIKNIHKI